MVLLPLPVVTVGALVLLETSQLRIVIGVSEACFTDSMSLGLFVLESKGERETN